jgi:hypothetical protein
MADVRHLTLEAALDDWISDSEMQGDYEGQGLEPPEAFAAMVRQAVKWVRSGVLVPGDMLEPGFVGWAGDPESNARRFAELAGRLTQIKYPGDICWFDTGPMADEEFKRLSV